MSPNPAPIGAASTVTTVLDDDCRPGWRALYAARRQTRPRRPFMVDGERVGSVDEAHLAALQPWSRWIEVQDRAVVLCAPMNSRGGLFEEVNRGLREQGLIMGWRDEPFPLLSPSTGQAMAVFERASARFWGTLTLGAHCNGWVAGPDGRPQQMWIARRSATKATDPGLLDNLVGGGVPFGQTPLQTLVREGFEEAGLSPAQMTRATPGRVIELNRDILEGRQFERLHVFDLQLQPQETPRNQDGEVGELHLWPLDRVAHEAAGCAMTVDAALVTLDFLVRHQGGPLSWQTALEALLV